MRVNLPAGKLLVELLLKVGIEEVLHSFGWLVQVIGGQVEVGFQEGFPQAVSPDDVAPGGAALLGELRVSLGIIGYESLLPQGES